MKFSEGEKNKKCPRNLAKFHQKKKKKNFCSNLWKMSQKSHLKKSLKNEDRETFRESTKVLTQNFIPCWYHWEKGWFFTCLKRFKNKIGNWTKIIKFEVFFSKSISKVLQIWNIFTFSFLRILWLIFVQLQKNTLQVEKILEDSTLWSEAS